MPPPCSPAAVRGLCGAWPLWCPAPAVPGPLAPAVFHGRPAPAGVRLSVPHASRGVPYSRMPVCVPRLTCPRMPPGVPRLPCPRMPPGAPRLPASPYHPKGRLPVPTYGTVRARPRATHRLPVPVGAVPPGARPAHAPYRGPAHPGPYHAPPRRPGAVGVGGGVGSYRPADLRRARHSGGPRGKAPAPCLPRGCWAWVYACSTTGRHRHGQAQTDPPACHSSRSRSSHRAQVPAASPPPSRRPCAAPRQTSAAGSPTGTRPPRVHVRRPPGVRGPTWRAAT